MEIKNGKVYVDPISNPKKITATKVPQILGIGTAGMYNTPFQVWCDIMRVYTKPFTENKYTNAGKNIEPKQLAYIKDKFDLTNLITPADRYPGRFDKMWDFFPEEKIFGGKWDSLTVDLNTGATRRIIECKTAQDKKRIEWEDGIPADYVVQASLYAWLMKVDGITFVVSFLEPEQYDNPQDYICTEDNTIFKQFFLSESFPTFEEKVVKECIAWWQRHILTGESPKYNETDPGDMAIVKKLQEEKSGIEMRSLF